ncbi:MAG: cob(I)yrinic acid a,c-diamide adenosyltransferase [Bifidobacteriaceae bacterium]|jgi:ATP:cob(I)alamin adenosyltransferase|nr:cob(I)yrinic acid a,c-diamide adenosyltransferase [Bifidobacteriaceae bacterium]
MAGKIYTKRGDKGSSRQMDGKFISKSDPQILAVGALDEAQSWLGIVIADLTPACAELKPELIQIQRKLYYLQADISIVEHASITEDDATALESGIDRMMDAVEPIHAFILPGGGHTGAQLQYARTLARRAERACVAFHEEKPERVNPEDLKFINRLSDYLYAMARYANHLDGISEVRSKDE